MKIHGADSKTRILQLSHRVLRRSAAAALIASVVLGGCALRPQTTSADGHCYTESGWLDATGGCSSRAGYPDCYLVCPETQTRRRL